MSEPEITQANREEEPSEIQGRITDHSNTLVNTLIVVCHIVYHTVHHIVYHTVYHIVYHTVHHIVYTSSMHVNIMVMLCKQSTLLQ